MWGVRGETGPGHSLTLPECKGNEQRGLGLCGRPRLGGEEPVLRETTERQKLESGQGKKRQAPKQSGRD